MMRPDYNRFFKVLDSEIQQPFAIASEDFSTIKIAHTETTSIDIFNDKDKPQGLLIDIFALNMADDGTLGNFAAFNEPSFLKTIAEIPDERDRNYFACLYANEFFGQSPGIIWMNDYYIKSLKYALR